MRRLNIFNMALSLAWLGSPLWQAAAQTAAAPAYQGSRFADLWQEVSSDPYEVWPEARVTPGRLYKGLTSLIYRASARTMERQDDLLPYFDKLIHPNGICLRGNWQITAPNPYSGYFARGSKGLVILRVSSTFGTTNGYERPVYGIAAKLFPSADPEHQEPLKTANFFLIEDFIFNHKTSFFDGAYTNDIINLHPQLAGLLGLPLNLLKALLVAPAGLLMAKDIPPGARENLASVLIRELYPIAELGLKPGQQSQAPVWMKLTPTESSTLAAFGGNDYRSELSLGAGRKSLKLAIEVASAGSRLGAKLWQKIGTIELEESTVSSSCDHRLHFHHPRARRAYSPASAFAAPFVGTAR